jgi:hypothetical protein
MQQNPIANSALKAAPFVASEAYQNLGGPVKKTEENRERGVFTAYKKGRKRSSFLTRNQRSVPQIA